MINIRINFTKRLVMKKVPVLICFYLGIWGILGFIVTLFLGFLSCCANVSEPAFFVLLGIFALAGLIASIVCTLKSCSKQKI